MPTITASTYRAYPRGIDVHYEAMPISVERQIRAEADHCYEWSNQPGARYAVHSHPYRKILYVATGSITFLPEGQPAIELRSGDRLDLPAGTPHAAVVGDRGVVCWEGQARAN
jgi:quercetin dioxygenase-like cupin family protein